MHTRTGTKNGILSNVKTGGKNGIFINTGAGASSSYLLDSFPNALFAFSVFRLSSTYSGACMNVRRSGDNATKMIYFVDDLLDTQEIINFCGGETGYITRWYDQSESQNDGSQIAASEQPIIYDPIKGINKEFNLPAVGFNGGQWLDSGVTDSQFSQFFIARNTISGVSVGFSGANVLYEDRYITQSDDVNFSNTWGLYTVDNLNTKGRLNGIDETGAASAFGQIFNRLLLGSVNGNTAFLAGNISEFIIYPFNIDQSVNITNIENNINNRFNIY
jgi:hypothetical protein